MAQRRMISRNLCSSRKLHAVNARCGKLGDFAQALFPRIVLNADDFGRLEGDVFTVRHKIFPVSPRTGEDFGKFPEEQNPTETNRHGTGRRLTPLAGRLRLDCRQRPQGSRGARGPVRLWRQGEPRRRCRERVRQNPQRT